MAHALNEARNHVQVHRYTIDGVKASLFWKDNVEGNRPFVQYLPFFLEEILQNLFGSRTRFEKMGLSLADNLRLDVVACRAVYTAQRAVVSTTKNLSRPSTSTVARSSPVASASRKKNVLHAIDNLRAESSANESVDNNSDESAVDAEHQRKNRRGT